MKADILIKNARVIDCFNKIDAISSVAVKNGKIIDADNVNDAKCIVNAAGCLVVPGLIDFHVHCAAGLSEIAVSPEAQCFPTGVTTIVDAGSIGVANYLAFRTITTGQRVRVKAFLNVCPSGLPTVKYHEELNPKYYDKDKILRFLEQYSDQLVGLKVRQSREIVGKLGVEPLLSTLNIAEKANCPVACHTTDAPAITAELTSYFRPGDVYAHVFHGKGNTILDKDGYVIPEIREAQERGVLFDAASGRSHFSLKVATAAVAQGFLPNIISTDITTNNHWIPGSAFSLPYTMSKCLAVGMKLHDVIKRVTSVPAAFLKLERELGSLSTGTCADIAVLSSVKKEITFCDAQGNELYGNTLLKTQMTIRDGTVVFRQIDF